MFKSYRCFKDFSKQNWCLLYSILLEFNINSAKESRMDLFSLRYSAAIHVADHFNRNAANNVQNSNDGTDSSTGMNTSTYRKKRKWNSRQMCKKDRQKRKNIHKALPYCKTEMKNMVNCEKKRMIAKGRRENRKVVL